MFTKIVIFDKASPEREEAISKINKIAQNSKRGMVFMIILVSICILAPKIIPQICEDWMKYLAVVFVVVSVFRFVDIIYLNRTLKNLISIQNSFLATEIDADE